MKTSHDSMTLRFLPREETAIEDFENSSLVLLRDAMELRSINRFARQVLAMLDGRRTVGDIARALAATSGAPAEYPARTVAATLRQLERHGIVRRDVRLTKQRNAPMQETRYLSNPDVSFRPEDDDGAILFNADNDALEVINPTAMAIWRLLSAPRTAPELVAHLCETFEDAPREQVERDVGDFLDGMVKKGFIGIVENPA